MAKTENILINQGTTFTKSYTATSGGIAIDLTNYTITSQLKKMFNSFAAYDFTVTKTDAANGVFEIEMTPEVSDLIEGGRYVYDIEIEDLSANKTRIFEGIAVIKPQVTSSNPYSNVQGIKVVNPDAIHVHDNKDQLDTVKWFSVAAGTSKTIEWGDRLIIDATVAYTCSVPDNPQVGFEFEFVDVNNTFATGNVIIQQVDTTLIDTIAVSGYYKAIWTGSVWKILQLG